MSKYAPPYPNAATDPFNQVPGMSKPSATSTADKVELPPSPEAPTMTADVELPPLPEQPGDFMTKFKFRKEAVAYARTCVAHATAAKDAEIEALRAEVQFLRSHRPIARKLAEVEARAERLAGAVFRKALGWRERTRLDKSDAQWMREKTYEQCADELDELLASLHPTAAQRKNNG